MPTGYQIKDQSACYFLTLQVVHWADIFTRPSYRDLIIESLNFCRRNKGLEIYAYVIMSNHLHLVVRSNENSLSNTIRDFKKFTTKQIINTIQTEPESRREWMLVIFGKAGKSNLNNKNYQVWRQDNHTIELYTNSVIDQKINYIHMNPVRAGIVEKAEDYIYSSARNYAELDYVLEIELI